MSDSSHDYEFTHTKPLQPRKKSIMAKVQSRTDSDSSGDEEVAKTHAAKQQLIPARRKSKSAKDHSSGLDKSTDDDSQQKVQEGHVPKKKVSAKKNQVSAKKKKAGAKSRGADFDKFEMMHLKAVIVRHCFPRGLPRKVERHDLKGIEAKITDWSEELGLPNYKERSVASWKSVWRKRKYQMFDIEQKPVDGRIAKGEKSKINVGSRVIVNIPVEAVVQGCKKGKVVLQFPNGEREWKRVKNEMRQIHHGEIIFDKNQLELKDETEDDDNEETDEETEAEATSTMNQLELNKIDETEDEDSEATDEEKDAEAPSTKNQLELKETDETEDEDSEETDEEKEAEAFSSGFKVMPISLKKSQRLEEVDFVVPKVVDGYRIRHPHVRLIDVVVLMDKEYYSESDSDSEPPQKKRAIDDEDNSEPPKEGTALAADLQDNSDNSDSSGQTQQMIKEIIFDSIITSVASATVSSAPTASMSSSTTASILSNSTSSISTTLAASRCALVCVKSD